MRIVNGHAERLRTAQSRPQQHELLDAIDAQQVFGDGALQHRFRRLAVGRRRTPGRLVGAVGAPFDEAELADVARERRLRDVEAGRAHAATQLLLAAHRRALNDVENDRLAPRFHGFSIHQSLD